MTWNLFRLLALLAIIAWLLIDWHVLRGPARRWMEKQMPAPKPVPEKPREAVLAPIEETPVAARVGELHIEIAEWREAMRERLWRTGQVWDELQLTEREEMKRAVLQELVDSKIVRQARLKNESGRTSKKLSQTADRELDQLKREFDQDQDFLPRLALRQTTEEELRTEIQEWAADQDWIELQLARSLQPVDEADVKRWIEEHPVDATLEIPAAFRVAHIYLTSHDAKKPDREPEIREIDRRLKAGEATFEQLAVEFSDDDRTKMKGGDLGWITQRRMPGDFMEIVGNMKTGQTSEPVRTALGWHIIRLLEMKVAHPAKMEEVGAEVAALLANERRKKAMDEWMANLRTEWKGKVKIDENVLKATEPAKRERIGE